jgi:predicted unusual protein kinase regulating ubiquinone biosynthesis (AarF/ABC1/UbiB family)
MLTGRARSRRILGFFTRLFATVLIWDIGLRKVGLTSVAEKNAEKRYIAIARDFRTLALELGGVLIKVGQFLSSRVDVLPEYLTDELKGLQDEVPAVPFPEIEARLIDELGPDWRQKFGSFDETTLAAASLGQTYRASLPTGERVIVKVQRPDIDALVEIDLDALTKVATWAMRYKAVSRRVDAPALLHEFAGVLRQELDYVNEAANAERFAELLADDPGVRIPEAYPERGTDRVLVLQDVGYLKITDYEARRCRHRPGGSGRSPAQDLSPPDHRFPVLPRRPASRKSLRPTIHRRRRLALGLRRLRHGRRGHP